MAVQQLSETLGNISEDFSLIDACMSIKHDAIGPDDLLSLKNGIKTNLFDKAIGGPCTQVYGFGLTKNQIDNLMNQPSENSKSPNAIKIYIGYDIADKRLAAYVVAAFDETAGVLDYKIRTAKTIDDVKNAQIKIEGTRPCPDNCSKNILSEKI